MRRTMLGLLLMLASAAASAGGLWSNVTVTNYAPWTSQGFSPSGTVVVTLSASSTGGPSCSSGDKTYAVVDITTVGGAMVAAVLQSARLTGATITVNGTGACTTNAAIENVSNVSE